MPYTIANSSIQNDHTPRFWWQNRKFDNTISIDMGNVRFNEKKLEFLIKWAKKKKQQLKINTRIKVMKNRIQSPQEAASRPVVPATGQTPMNTDYHSLYSLLNELTVPPLLQGRSPQRDEVGSQESNPF